MKLCSRGVRQRTKSYLSGAGLCGIVEAGVGGLFPFWTRWWRGEGSVSSRQRIHKPISWLCWVLVRQEKCGLEQGGLRTSHLFGPAVDSEQGLEGRPLTYSGVGVRHKCEPIYVHSGSFKYNSFFVFSYQFVVDFHQYTRKIKVYIIYIYIYNFR